MVTISKIHTDIPIPEGGGLIDVFRTMAVGHCVDVSWTSRPAGIYSTAARAQIRVKVRTEFVKTGEETQKVLRIWRIQ
jgi:hypothetical protein